MMTAVIFVIALALIIGMVMFWTKREEYAKAESQRIYDLRRKLEHFAFLDDGWNGYDAKPISKKTITMAWNVLHSMEMSGTSGGWEVFPVATGSILFEYTTKDRDWFVEVFEDKYVMEHEGIERTSTDLATVWRWMRRKNRLK